MTGTIIFDAQGLCLRSLLRGKDDQGMPKEDGSVINTAEHGFRQWLHLFYLPALEKVAPLNIIAVWDGGNDLRKGWYPNYKANRPAKADRDKREVEQEQKLFTYVKQFMAGMGSIAISCAKTEADDLIALLVQKLSGPIEIQTVDADLSVLSSSEVSVYVRSKLIEGDYKGIPTRLMSLNKSLVGDTSDNYNGVAGFGPKTWDWMLNEYGEDGLLELQHLIDTDDHKTLQAVAGENDDKALQKLAEPENWVRWRLMWQLASLHPEACYRTSKTTVIRPVVYKRVPQWERVAGVLNACAAFVKQELLSPYMVSDHLVTADNVEEWKAHLLAHIDETPVISFDYEGYDTLKHPAFQEAKSATSDYYVDVLSQSVTGASFNYGNNLQYTIYVSVDHRDTANCSKDDIADLLCEIPPEKLCVHNASFEGTVSEIDEGIGVELEAPADTFIMAAYVDEDDLKGLKHLSKKHLNYTQATYKETLAAAGAEDMRGLSGEQVLSYGCDDATVTGQLFVIFRLLTTLEDTYEEMRKYEFPAIHPLNHAFINGVRLDTKRLKELEIEDAEVVRSGMERVRAALEEHCSEIVDAGAHAYFKDNIDFYRAKLRDQGKTQGEIEDTLNTTKAKLIASSQYRPYQEVREVVEFLPTKVQFQKVCNLLKIEDTLPPEYQAKLEAGTLDEWPSEFYDLTFPSPSASGITRWLLEVEAWLDQLDAPPEREADIRKFTTLLPQAAHQIRDRKGDDYDALKDFCTGILQETAKTYWDGDELNFDSPNQNASLLYCKLQLPIRVRTKVQRGSARYRLGFYGSPATDDKAIETAIAEDCTGENEWKRDVLQTIRDVKAALTRAKLYYKPYPLWEHPRDGMLHPQIINCGTVTQRPTGTSPNFLQITKKDGGKLRSCILPRHEDHIIISPDFSGQELRILASECKDPVLLDAYLGEVEKDLHSITAASIVPIAVDRYFPQGRELVDFTPAGVDYDDFCEVLDADFDSEQWLDELGADRTELFKTLQKLFKQGRKEAKVVNFLINYLGGAATLSRNLGIQKELAQTFMDKTFHRYAGIQPWQQSVMRFGAVHGYTQTAYGTRRHLTSDILSNDGFIRSRSERQAVNFVVQGCAARILKIVLTEVWRSRLLQETGAVIIAPVYDELTASVPISAAVEYIQRLSEIMTVTPPGHAIPMKPEVDLGPTWGTMTSLGAYPSVDRIEEELDKIRTKKRAAA